LPSGRRRLRVNWLQQALLWEIGDSDLFAMEKNGIRILSPFFCPVFADLERDSQNFTADTIRAVY